MSPTKRPSGVPGLRSAITGPLPAEAPAVPAVAAPPETGLDEAVLSRWRWTLAATARKAAAARARAGAAEAAWARLVADARDAGVPALMVVAAAADAGVDVPGAG